MTNALQDTDENEDNLEGLFTNEIDDESRNNEIVGLTLGKKKEEKFQRIRLKKKL